MESSGWNKTPISNTDKYYFDEIWTWNFGNMKSRANEIKTHAVSRNQETKEVQLESFQLKNQNSNQFGLVTIKDKWS